MGQVAQILNIQVHKVNNIELYGPGDLEVHQGKDNRQYVLDFGRCKHHFICFY